MEEEQRRIAIIQSQAQFAQQNARQFLMGDEEMQSSRMADAMMQIEEEAAEMIGAQGDLSNVN